MFCLLVFLIKLSLLANYLATKKRLRRPNVGEGMISVKSGRKGLHVFLDLLFWFIVLLCISVVCYPYVT